MANSSESPTEGTGLLQPGSDHQSQPETGRESPAGWWGRNGRALPSAFLAAFVIGVNEGYTKNTNTTYIGKDMGEMQDGVIIVLLPTVASALVPPLVPFLRRNLSRSSSMLIGPLAMAVGFLGSGTAGVMGSPRPLWLIALWQCISTFGIGLLNLLTYLAIREATESSPGYAHYRACYQIIMTSGMVVGALGGPAIIRYFEQTAFATALRPWQFPFLLEFIFVLGLFWVIYSNPGSREEDGLVSESVWSGLLETVCAVLLTGTPATLCSILILWDMPVSYFVMAFILWLIFATLLISLRFETTSLYPVNVVGSRQVRLLVGARATASVMVQTLQYRLPLYFQIRMMIEAGPDKQRSHLVAGSRRQGLNTEVGSFHFPDDYMLPVHSLGILLGEFGAAAAIKQLGRESTPLAGSLLAYFTLVQLFGHGITGSLTGASLGPIAITLFAGIANGSADNCLSSFLFAAVGERDRPAAEALSSQAGNIVSAMALAYAPLRYESLLRDGLARAYGEKEGQKFADVALKDISAVDSFPSGPRYITLQYARNGIESNIWEVDLVLLADYGNAKYIDYLVSIKYISSINDIDDIDYINSLNHIYIVSENNDVESVNINPVNDVHSPNHINLFNHANFINSFHFNYINCIIYTYNVNHLDDVNAVNDLNYINPINRINYIDYINNVENFKHINYIINVYNVNHVNHIDDNNYFHSINCIKHIDNINNIIYNHDNHDISSSTTSNHISIMQWPSISSLFWREWWLLLLQRTQRWPDT
ncbi:hypothetical protein CLAIMM_03704 [Cladophialophora immunda]|nr:hypothetical protein CLAIMM_03704 [Cladophialophora immunda]